MRNKINIPNNELIKAGSFSKVDKISLEIKEQVKYKLYNDGLILL